ncbi:esterase family protein [Actinokineospora sp. PR83]|uniref:alpha/beta hydrolase n=1 Tax=Actinokineospora sp. PR83 TaxID=2884908 RepID=UPI001F1D4E60|nr:alpha/beta hydrolase family protein [Actinokineospora sp. PR83]MCG8914418.1 esterase family protein [Actinokineospora sp. PR83]
MAHRRTRWLLALALLASTAVAVPFTLPAPQAAAAAVTADDGARVVEEVRVDQRTLDLRIASPALRGDGWVRLLLPSGWDGATRTWPALWLLHGCCENADYRSWSAYSDIAALAAPLDLIVVQPSDGKAGMYSKWWNFGRGDGQDWDRFHTEEVRQIVERGYKSGTRRVVAGLSVGGYGAMAYAFRHPGMFVAAASFSGAPNTLLPTVPLVLQGLVAMEGYNPLDLWGDEIFQRQRWSDNNPYDHTDKLRGTALYVSSGNGIFGPLDFPGAADPVEPASFASSQSFVWKLRSQGIAVTEHFYQGTHTWPYWKRELRTAWPWLTANLGL